MTIHAPSFELKTTRCLGWVVVVFADAISDVRGVKRSNRNYNITSAESPEEHLVPESIPLQVREV